LTSANGSDSIVQSIGLGVPQGSCFGPLLFSIYINDVPNAISDSTVFIDADETCIRLQTDNILDLNDTLNKDLEALVNDYIFKYIIAVLH